MKYKDIVIAIDGYSSCGKSTLAKALSQVLGYAFIDTGAMYRAVTLYFIRNDIDLANSLAVLHGLEEIDITFKNIDGKNLTFLNGVLVEEEIREMYVSEQVSNVAAISAVRRKMVEQQQKMGATKRVVLDGRDIGTIVFPNAELKLFLTASFEERVNRRFKELVSKGKSVTKEEIANNLNLRDHIDTTRADSPLKMATDAILIDNTHLTPVDQLEKVLQLVEERREV